MIEPVPIEEYASPATFRLFDATPGGDVLFHAAGGMFAGDAVDLIFLGADYLQASCEMRGLTVTQPRDLAAVELERAYSRRQRYEEPEGKRVFTIESEGGRFRVVASKMWVIVRAHDGKSSLPVLLGDDLAAREAFIAQRVREWYRMAALSD